ncbi:MAG: addiction module protein [Myxococcales bacterium]|nr:addiction module protein [Myxococcales bacterium]
MDDASRILRDALGLDRDARVVVARELFASLEPREGELHTEWEGELRRRIDAVEAGTAELESWADLRERVKAACRP